MIDRAGKLQGDCGAALGLVAGGRRAAVSAGDCADGPSATRRTRHAAGKRLQAFDSIRVLSDEFYKCGCNRANLSALFPFFDRARTHPKHVRPHSARNIELLPGSNKELRTWRHLDFRGRDGVRAKGDLSLAMGLHGTHAFHQLGEEIALGCVLLLHFPPLVLRAARSASSAFFNWSFSSFVRSVASSLSYSVSSQISCSERKQ